MRLINKKLKPESYDKIVAGAQDVVKKTHDTICTKEVIDLTASQVINPPTNLQFLLTSCQITINLKIKKSHCQEPSCNKA